MEAVLDSSFIVSCLRKRIDFLRDLEEKGFKVVIPRQVLQELKDLQVKKGQSHDVRIAIGAALEMFESHKVKKMSLGDGTVDQGLINKGQEGVYIATLDKGIQRKINNRIIIQGDKKISIERS